MVPALFRRSPNGKYFIVATALPAVSVVKEVPGQVVLADIAEVCSLFKGHHRIPIVVGGHGRAPPTYRAPNAALYLAQACSR